MIDESGKNRVAVLRLLQDGQQGEILIHLNSKRLKNLRMFKRIHTVHQVVNGIKSIFGIWI